MCVRALSSQQINAAIIYHIHNAHAYYTVYIHLNCHCVSTLHGFMHMQAWLHVLVNQQCCETGQTAGWHKQNESRYWIDQSRYFPEMLV